MFSHFILPRSLGDPRKCFVYFGMQTGNWCGFEYGSQNIHLLTLDGQIKQVAPYDVIYWATYPIENFPYRGTVNVGSDYPIKIITKTDGFIPLVEGWPIHFTKEKIAFLTTDGLETIIDRQSIWKVETQESTTKAEFSGRGTAANMDFVHPYIFRDCPANSKASVRYYPQQILVDPITIKRELDQLRRGHEGVQRYVREQTFYPVPQMFFNKTHLGIWQNFGSRYGAGGKRTNNFTPILTNDYSSDVFDYQHRFSSGAAPLPFMIHEEAQTHVSYQFKASYFHLRTMVDPNYILVGSSYSWQDYTFTSEDDRVNDGAIFELGFDYSKFSVQLYLLDNVHIGVKMTDRFVSEQIGLPRWGLRYENFWFFSEFSYGKGFGDFPTKAKLNLSVSRLNIGTKYFKGYQLLYSLIVRKLLAEASTTTTNFQYDSTSISNSLGLEKEIGERFTLFGQLSVEKQNKSFGTVGQLTNADQWYPKMGFGGSLSF